MNTGRPAKPTAIKRLESANGRRDRGGRLLRTDEVQPEPAPVSAELPKPPKELSRRAKQTWNRIQQALARSGLITPLDGLQLAYYCELDAHFWELRKKGEMMPSGQVAQLRAFAAMFGLDPSSRARPTFPGVRPDLPNQHPDAGNELDRLRQRKRGSA